MKKQTYGTFNLREQMWLETREWDGVPTIGMSFAQRKFIGFRCKYEYDAKVVMVYSDRQIILLTYTLESMGESTFSHLLDKNVHPNDDKNSDRSSFKSNNARQDPDQMHPDGAKQARIILKWQVKP